MAWSAADPALLLSTGKDGRTLLWDALGADERADPLGELRAPGGWAFDVQWAPSHPGVFALPSFSGSAQGGKARPRICLACQGYVPCLAGGWALLVLSGRPAKRAMLALPSFSGLRSGRLRAGLQGTVNCTTVGTSK